MHPYQLSLSSLLFCNFQLAFPFFIPSRPHVFLPLPSESSPVTCVAMRPLRGSISSSLRLGMRETPFLQPSFLFLFMDLPFLSLPISWPFLSSFHVPFLLSVFRASHPLTGHNLLPPYLLPSHHGAVGQWSGRAAVGGAGSLIYHHSTTITAEEAWTPQPLHPTLPQPSPSPSQPSRGNQHTINIKLFHLSDVENVLGNPPGFPDASSRLHRGQPLPCRLPLRIFSSFLKYLRFLSLTLNKKWSAKFSLPFHIRRIRLGHDSMITKMAAEVCVCGGGEGESYLSQVRVALSS